MGEIGHLCQISLWLQSRLKEGKHGNDALRDPCSCLKEKWWGTERLEDKKQMWGMLGAIIN